MKRKSRLFHIAICAVTAGVLNWWTAAAHGQQQARLGAPAAGPQLVGQQLPPVDQVQPANQPGPMAPVTAQVGNFLNYIGNGPNFIPADVVYGVPNAPGNRRGGFYAGVGFYLIQPFWESNPAAFSRLAGPVGPKGANTFSATTSQMDFNYGYRMAPRIYAGYESASGLGVRVGWWRFDQSAGLAASVRPNGPGTLYMTDATGNLFSSSASLGANQRDMLDFTSALILDVWDFDVTQRILDNNRWFLIAGGGIRYAHLSQDYHAFQSRLNPTPGGLVSSAVYSSNTFNGAGPTFFAEGRRYLGNTRFALYSNARAGILFGTGAQNNFGQRVYNGFDHSPDHTYQTAVLSRRDDVLPFISGELGIQWQGPNIGAFQPFARVGVVGQGWFGAGNGSSTGINNFGNLGFFGMTFLVGTYF